MNPLIRTAIPALAAAAGLAIPPCVGAQAQVRPPDLEALVRYSQCIRANGYAEFPDPAGDGRLLLLRRSPK